MNGRINQVFLNIGHAKFDGGRSMYDVVEAGVVKHMIPCVLGHEIWHDGKGDLILPIWMPFKYLASLGIGSDARLYLIALLHLAHQYQSETLDRR